MRSETLAGIMASTSAGERTHRGLLAGGAKRRRPRRRKPPDHLLIVLVFTASGLTVFHDAAERFHS